MTIVAIADGFRHLSWDGTDGCQPGTASAIEPMFHHRGVAGGVVDDSVAELQMMGSVLGIVTRALGSYLLR